jgi:hypothetical protein
MELKMIKKNSNGPIYGYLNDRKLIDLEQAKRDKHSTTRATGLVL